MSGYEPRFDIDRDYGEEGEQTVRRLLGLTGTRVEVKRKRYVDDMFYVETAHLPRGADGYKASGINTTEAECWAYVVADTGLVFFFPTRLLKRAALQGTFKEEKDGGNPTKGRLVTLGTVFAAARNTDELPAEILVAPQPHTPPCSCAKPQIRPDGRCVVCWGYGSAPGPARKTPPGSRP